MVQLAQVHPTECVFEQEAHLHEAECDSTHDGQAHSILDVSEMKIVRVEQSC